MKTHWAIFWSEFRGRYRFIYSLVPCLATMHFLGDGIKVSSDKKKVNCKNCKRLKSYAEARKVS